MKEITQLIEITVKVNGIYCSDKDSDCQFLGYCYCHLYDRYIDNYNIDKPERCKQCLDNFKEIE